MHFCSRHNRIWAMVVSCALLLGGCQEAETRVVVMELVTPSPTPQTVQLSMPAATPAPTRVPTPVPTDTPVQTDTPTPAPTEAPTPTPTADWSEVATPKPAKDAGAVDDADEDDPTPKPTKTPKPTPKPTKTPKPTAEPTLEPTPKPTPTPTPEPNRENNAIIDVGAVGSGSGDREESGVSSSSGTSSSGSVSTSGVHVSSGARFTAEEIALAARVAYFESAKNEQGFRAVLTVILNRVNASKWPDTVREVIYQNKQFTVIDRSDFLTRTIPDEVYEYANDVFNNGNVLFGSNIMSFRSGRTDKVWGDRHFEGTYGGNDYYSS